MPELKNFYTEPTAEELVPYLTGAQPPLNLDSVSVPLLEGPERTTLTVPTTGDASLAITLVTKGRRQVGAVTSFALPDTELDLLQLQGGPGGYRLTAGMRWEELFADLLLGIGTHPDSPLERITMLESTTGHADNLGGVKRYTRFRGRLGMRFSAEEQRYVAELPKRRG